MDILIIVLLILHSAVKDYLFYKEREKLQLKLMSKDVKEYVDTVAPPPPDTKQKEDPFINIEDASIEQILKAKDTI